MSRLTLPLRSISRTTTVTLSPSEYTSSTFSIRLPPPIFEICSRPSRPGRMLTNAPNDVMFTTSPSYSLPTSASGGKAIWSTFSLAAASEAPSADPIRTVPSSSISSVAPVSSSISRIIFPLGPMISPILSLGIETASIRGAVSASSGRGSEMILFISPRMCRRASRACANAPTRTSAGRPSILVSSCSAVMTSAVPATLKSMSPSASSTPRMSVSVTNPSSWAMSPIATPATAALMGTPASISDRLDPQTDAIDDEPLLLSTSETRRNAYGKSSAMGITGSTAFSARTPCPISRRFGPRMNPVSPVENGGKL